MLLLSIRVYIYVNTLALRSESSARARVAKLVDAYASGAYVAIHGGSSPLPGTIQKKTFFQVFFLYSAREVRRLRVLREDLKMLSMS